MEEDDTEPTSRNGLVIAAVIGVLAVLTGVGLTWMQDRAEESDRQERVCAVATDLAGERPEDC